MDPTPLRGNENGLNWTQNVRRSEIKAEKHVPFPIKFQLIHKDERVRNAKTRDAHFAIHYSSSDAGK